MNDEISGIFDHLNPEDFIIATSAVDEHAGSYRGVDGFNAFVDQQLRSLRSAYAAADGNVNPIAILASGSVLRVFAPEDDENMGQYMGRLAREARTIGAHWFFISRKTMVGMHETEQLHDIGDPEVVRRLLEAGQLEEGVIWYAERREGDETHQRNGYLTIVGNRLGEMVELDSPQPFELFGLVLRQARTN